MALERVLIKLLIVKGTEFRRQATQRPYQGELPGDPAGDKTELVFLCKLKTPFSFALRLSKRIACHQKIGVQLGTTVSRISEIADAVRDFKRASQEITAGPNMSRPGHDETEHLERPALEALQLRFFDQLTAQAAKSKSGIVVAEMRPGQHGEQFIGGTRSVAVAVLKAKIDGSTGRQGSPMGR